MEHEEPSSSTLMELEGTPRSSINSISYAASVSFEFSSPQTVLAFNKENQASLEDTGIKSVIQKFPDEEHMNIIAQIEKCWLELKLPEHELEKRQKVIADSIADNVTKLLHHTLELQKGYRDTVQQCVSRYLKDIHDMEQWLNLQSDATSEIEIDDKIGLYDKEIRLRARCNELLGIRKKRQTLWNALIKDNHKFSAATGLLPFYLSDDNIRLRTETLSDLQQCNAELQATFAARTKSMTLLRTRTDAVNQELRNESVIFDWSNLTDANIEAAESLLSQLNLMKADNIVDGTGIMERIEYLCRRTSITSALLENQPTIAEHLYDPAVLQQLSAERDRLEVEAKQNIRTVILRYRDRLLTLYNDTYASAEERAAFKDIDSDDFTDGLLDSHEAETTRLDERFESNRHIYSLLTDHGVLLREKLKFEEQEMDPVVMQNRGGILLKIQADKKKVVKDLNKVVTDLRSEVDKKCREAGPPFLMEGMPLEDYLTKRQRDAEHEKADFLKDRKAAPGSARKVAPPGSATKRTKDFKDKDTPTLKRLKNEAGAVPGSHDKSHNSTFVLNDSKVVKEKPVEVCSYSGATIQPGRDTHTGERMGKIQRRLKFDNHGADSNEKLRPRNAAQPRTRMNTPASSSTSINSKGHK